MSDSKTLVSDSTLDHIGENISIAITEHRDADSVWWEPKADFFRVTVDEDLTDKVGEIFAVFPTNLHPAIAEYSFVAEIESCEKTDDGFELCLWVEDSDECEPSWDEINRQRESLEARGLVAY